MPETHWHVRSAITGARVIVDVTEEQANGEAERLNREAETGVRAAYDDGHGGRVAEQRLVAENTGQALTSPVTFPEQNVTFMGPDNLLVQVPLAVAEVVERTGKYQRLAEPAVRPSDADLLHPSLVGKVLQAGQPMKYEVEREERMTEDEIEAERKRLEAERTQT